MQLTKSYCKQNKTFLGNTTVTDYVGSDLRLDTDRRVVEGGGGGWKINQRGGGLMESAGGFLLDQRNQRANSEAEREQASPSANRRARREQAIPQANLWMQVGQGTLSEPRRGGTRAASLQKENTLRRGAGGWCRRGPGRESAGGSLTRQLRSISQRFEPGAGRASLSQSEAGEVVRGRGWLELSQSEAEVAPSVADRPSGRRTASGRRSLGGERRLWRLRWQRQRWSGQCW